MPIKFIIEPLLGVSFWLTIMYADGPSTRVALANWNEVTKTMENAMEVKA